MVPSCIGRCQHAVLIVDEKLNHIAQTLSSNLITAGYRTSLLSVPSGEGSKSIEEATRLWQAMLTERTDRGSQ